jgi:hypothetical protein
LDDWGVSKGELRSIPYDDWLLKFVISVQWRVLTTSTKLEDAQLENERIRSRFADAMDAALCNWANYLLGYRDTSGDERHYIIFLQNLAAATSYFPERLNDNVNGYLLRTVDSTIAYSSKNLLLYTKIGPIVLITGLRPYELKGMKGAQIRKRGSVNTAQKLDNADVNEFVLFTRPNEAMSRLNISEKQYRKISADVERRILSSKHLHSVHALESDFLLRERGRRT